MTHPTLTPRGEYRAAVEPAPIELIPRGACKSKVNHGRTVALCLRCSRKDAPGPQMEPRVVRILGVSECPDFVPHGCMVLAIECAAQAAELGAVANTAPEGVTL
jgi:hypothetical protein